MYVWYKMGWNFGEENLDEFATMEIKRLDLESKMGFPTRMLHKTSVQNFYSELRID